MFLQASFSIAFFFYFKASPFARTICCFVSINTNDYLIWSQDQKVTFLNENSKLVRYVSKPGTVGLNEVAAYSRDRLREREKFSSCIRVRTLTMSRATRFFFFYLAIAQNFARHLPTIYYRQLAN